MTTNELIKLIEELGLTPDFDHVLYCDGEEHDVLSVFNREGTVANVYVNMVGLWYCHESYFDKLEPHKRHKLLDAIIEYSYTPVIDREEEKRYIFPLPGLITTDGDQQYLTQKGGHWFACRRKKNLRQTWTEKEIVWIPEEYRHLKTEVSEWDGKE